MSFFRRCKSRRGRAKRLLRPQQAPMRLRSTTCVLRKFWFSVNQNFGTPKKTLLFFLWHKAAKQKRMHFSSRIWFYFHVWCNFDTVQFSVYFNFCLKPCRVIGCDSFFFQQILIRIKKSCVTRKALQAFSRRRRRKSNERAGWMKNIPHEISLLFSSRYIYYVV